MNSITRNEKEKMDLKDKTANFFVLFSIVRGTLNNLGFTNNMDSSQLSGICFNKILKVINK